MHRQTGIHTLSTYHEHVNMYTKRNPKPNTRSMRIEDNLRLGVVWSTRSSGYTILFPFTTKSSRKKNILNTFKTNTVWPAQFDVYKIVKQ